MKKFTNHAPGARGIRTKDGLVMIEPGKTVEIDPKEIVGEMPDLGKAAPKSEADDEADALRARIAELEEQASEQGEEITRLTAELDKATAPKK